MTDWLTEVPWGWYAAGLVLLVGLLYLANWYEDRRLPRESLSEFEVQQAVRPSPSHVEVDRRR